MKNKIKKQRLKTKIMIKIKTGRLIQRNSLLSLPLLPLGQPVDWRVLYAESKEAGLLNGQRKKKKRKDGPKEKDKERRKRDKEKEKIKRKIKMATGGDGKVRDTKIK